LQQGQYRRQHGCGVVAALAARAVVPLGSGSAPGRRHARTRTQAGDVMHGRHVARVLVCLPPPLSMPGAVDGRTTHQLSAYMRACACAVSCVGPLHQESRGWLSDFVVIEPKSWLAIRQFTPHSFTDTARCSDSPAGRGTFLSRSQGPAQAERCQLQPALSLSLLYLYATAAESSFDTHTLTRFKGPRLVLLLPNRLPPPFLLVD
jgi:hypothetical protein